MILGPENFWVPKNLDPEKFLVRICVWRTTNVQAKLVSMLDMSLEVKLLENGSGGGRVAIFYSLPCCEKVLFSDVL